MSNNQTVYNPKFRFNKLIYFFLNLLLKDKDKNFLKLPAENANADQIVKSLLSSTDDFSKLSDPKTYINSCNSSKLNNFFHIDTQSDPSLNISSDHDYKTPQITSRKESYGTNGTTMTSETYDSNISIFKQLESDLTEKTNENMIRSISRFSNFTNSTGDKEELPKIFKDEKSLFLKKKFFQAEK